MSLFNSDFEIKKCLVDMLDKATFGQAEAITTALDKWEELEKLKKEYDFTREYIHDNGLNGIYYLNALQERSNKMYTVTEVAKMFSVSRQTVLKWIKTGKIKAVKAVKVYRIPNEEIERLLADREAEKGR